MWSIANEPDTRPQGAREYFAPLAEATRKLDPTRPITCVNVMFCDAHTDTISDLFDVLCLNRYYGWYVQSGDLETAEKVLEKNFWPTAGETASADYHHRIRRGYVSRAALNVHRHVE